MKSLPDRNAWKRVEVPHLGAVIRRARGLPGSSILVEYRRPKQKVRRDRAEALPPIPLAEGPLTTSVIRA